MAPGSINVLSGDFKKGMHHRYSNCFMMRKDRIFLREKLSSSLVDKLEIANDENVISIGGSVGWGLAGAALLGPVGMLTGIIFGGKRGKNITFVCKFKDGRKFIGVTSERTFSSIKQSLLISDFEDQDKSESKPAKSKEPESIFLKVALYTIIALIILAWMIHK